MSDDMKAIWDAIAAPLDPSQIKQKPTFYTDKKSGEKKQGSNISYIDKTTVEERLNSVVPGDWHFQVTPVVVPNNGSDGQWVVKGSLTICGVTREDFGVNEQEDRFDPPKAAVSDALKRCAALFGLGRELVPGHGQQRGPATTARPKQAPASAPTAAPGRTETPAPVSSEGAAQEWPQRPWNATWVKRFMETQYDTMSEKAKTTAMTPEEHKKLGMAVGSLFPDRATRHVFQYMMFGEDNVSIDGMSVATGKTYKAWALDTKNAKVEVDAIIATQEFAELGRALAEGRTELG